jgi:glucose-6-phosphate 1-dehydrogenase
MFRGFNLTQNHVRLRISPDVSIAIGTNVISPEDDNVSRLVEMIATQYPAAEEMDAYERLLRDAMAGDSTLFARQDYVEEAWRIVDPILKSPPPLHTYGSGVWGPAETHSHMTPPGGWHVPVPNGAAPCGEASEKRT